jgi:protocatechuate 3,4-dioxygenase, alpha subunit
MNTNKLQATPSQTIGPFFAYSLTAQQYGYDFNSIVNGNLINDEAEDKQIFISGNVFDGEGNAIHDAMIELWQADANGNYPNIPISNIPISNIPISNIPISNIQISNIQIPQYHFSGFGRLGTGTEEDKSFTFKTIKPGKVNNQAPHINVILFMRGSLHALYTRIYFEDEQNDDDPLYKSIDIERRKTLLAKRMEKNEKTFYRFNIYMQGENETIFFDVHN